MPHAPVAQLEVAAAAAAQLLAPTSTALAVSFVVQTVATILAKERCAALMDTIAKVAIHVLPQLGNAALQ